MIVSKDNNGFLIYASRSEVKDFDYSNLLTILASKPDAPDGYMFKLKYPELEWVLFKEPEPVDFSDSDKAEAYDILTGVSE